MDCNRVSYPSVPSAVEHEYNVGADLGNILTDFMHAPTTCATYYAKIYT